jgi:hypothetical protein
LQPFLGAHAVAAGVYLAVFLVAPLVLGFVVAILLVFAGILFQGDPGGPLFLPVTFVMGLLYAGCVVGFGVVLFLAASGIQYLRSRVRIPFWTPVVLAVPVAFTLLTGFGTPAVVLSLAAGAAFSIYWLTLSGSEAVLSWGRRKWGKGRGKDGDGEDDQKM